MIYSFSKLGNGGGGGGTDLSGVVASADLSGTTLNLENNSGTTIDSVELSGLTENFVSSQSVTTIWKGTQQEYDAITTKDSLTIYIII